MIRMVLIFTVVILTAVKAIAAEPIKVFAGIPPVAYLVERIGGDRVHVDVFIQPGQDPHTFEPAPKQIQALANAKLFFKVGMPFEDQLLTKIQGVHHRLIVVDTSEGIEKRRLSANHVADKARHDDERLHAGPPTDLDPHVWLSPPQVKKLAANIATALGKADPDGAAFFKANLVQLERELAVVDAKISLALKPYAGRTFYVFHPAFGYFADCYRLKEEAIEAEGKQPLPKQLRGLIEKAKTEHARIIFVQPQFDRHSAQAVADAVGGRIVPINDMEKDIIANLQDIAGKIERAFKESRISR